MRQNTFQDLYLCLVCGWSGPTRQMLRNRDNGETRLICPRCRSGGLFSSYDPDREDVKFMLIRARDRREELDMETPDIIQDLERD